MGTTAFMMGVAAVLAAGGPPAAPPDGASSHAAALAEHARTPTDPALIDGPVLPAVRSGKPCATVFGFLPYWASSANTRWDLLTHLGVFGVEVAGDGSVTNTRGWPWTSTIATARANTVKVLLTVINFDPAQLRTLLTSTTNRTRLINNLKALTLNTADGVVLDFEGSGSNGWPALVPTFISDLRSALRTQDPDAEVWIATPAVNWGNAWNLTAVAAQADGLFIMGYDFYGSWSTTSGPSSPLTGGSINITNTLDVQYAGPRVNFADKLVLGLPWYGNQWRTATGSAYSGVTSYVGSSIYTSAQSLAGTHGRQWDAASGTPWVRWQASGQWNQVWFDDAQSLDMKQDAALSRGLGGVGMWALSYQGSGPALWDVITQNTVTPCPCAADFNNDGVGDLADFFAFLNAFDENDPAADLNGDNAVDLADFFDYLNAFDLGC